MSTNLHSLRVALAWQTTVFQERSFGRGAAKDVTVGNADSNVLPIESEQLPDSFSMFERTSSGYKVRVPDSLDGEFSVNGKELDFDGFKSTASRGASTGKGALLEAELSPGDWGVINIGDMRLIFQVYDDAPAAVPVGVPAGLTPTLLVCLIASSSVHIFFLIYAFLQYSEEAELNQILIENRFVQLMVQDVKDPPKEKEPEDDIVEEDTTGKKAGGEEGKFGKEDSEIEESKIPKVDGKMVDNIDVKNLGVNKALSSDILGQGPLKNIFGNQDGFDAKMNVAMSGEGGDLQIGRGAGGMGMRGLGGGGGGDGLGRIGGLGKVDTGGGKGATGKIGRGKRKKVTVKMQRGTPKIGDFCDKNDIRRVVGAKSRAITFCFEKELQSKPALKGKIIAQWQVGLDGKVMSSSIASSTMGDKAVEGCITRVISRMRFKPPNGGICIINFPFVFSGLE